MISEVLKIIGNKSFKLCINCKSSDLLLFALALLPCYGLGSLPNVKPRATLIARDPGKANSKRSELGLQARDSSHLGLEFLDVTFGSELLQLQSPRYNI